MKSKDTEPVKIDFVIDFDVFESDEYKRHFAMVGRNPLGHTIDQRVVYTPQLAFILTQRLTGFDRLLNEHIKNKANFDFLKLYSEAYDKGFEYFKTEYLQTDVYLMPQLEFWVKKIDRLYYHDGVYRFGGVANGWNFVKKKYPLIITNEVLHEYGFYSGLCASAEKFNHENKEIFEKYEISVEPEKVENVEPEKSEFEIAFDEFFNDALSCKKIVESEFKRLKKYLSEYFEGGERSVLKPVSFQRVDQKSIGTALNRLHWKLTQKGLNENYFNFIGKRIKKFESFDFEKFKEVCQNNIEWKGQK